MWEFFRRLWRKPKPDGDSEPGRKDFDAAVGHYERGEYAAAIAAYGRVIRLRPNIFAAYANRGFAHHEMENYAAAIADYDRAIEIDPKIARVL
jgi:tetratricopeptide (TPR) repeat protein